MKASAVSARDERGDAARGSRPRWRWTVPSVTVGMLVALLGFDRAEPVVLMVGFTLTSLTLVAFLWAGLTRSATS